MFLCVNKFTHFNGAMKVQEIQECVNKLTETCVSVIKKEYCLNLLLLYIPVNLDLY